MFNNTYHGILSREMKEQTLQAAAPTPCQSRKPTPTECIMLGIDLGKAQIMTINDLTKEDAALILNSGHGPAVIQKLYSIKSPGSLYPKLIAWGLHEKGQPRRDKTKHVHLMHTDDKNVSGGGIPAMENQNTGKSPEIPAADGTVQENRLSDPKKEKTVQEIQTSVNEAAASESTAAKPIDMKQRVHTKMASVAVPIMQQLYPHGISLAQIEDALTVSRIVDKLSQIAQDDNKPSIEEKWLDIAGYAVIAMENHLIKSGG